MKTSCSSLSYLRLLVLAFLTAIGLGMAPSAIEAATKPATTHAAKPVAKLATKTDAKAKKPAKWKSGAKGKSKKAQAAHTKKAPAKSAKVAPAKKATTKKEPAKSEVAKKAAAKPAAKKEAPATASKAADTKDKGKKALSAKPAPKHDAKEKAHANTTMDDFDAQAEDVDETSSSPLLLVFVLFVVASVGGFYYMKKKQAEQADAPKGEDFAATDGEAFTSELSSLDVNKKRTPSPKPGAGDKLAEGSGFEGVALSGMTGGFGGKSKNDSLGWFFGLFNRNKLANQLRGRSQPSGSFGGSDDMTTTNTKPMKDGSKKVS